MLDKNGKEIKTGDVVMISGAYFKTDNGLYFVDRSPGDPAWLGAYHSLWKLNKNGTLCRSKYRLGSWPLSCYVNSYEKRIEANTWNKKHAEIEIVSFAHMEGIKAHFREEQENTKERFSIFEKRGLVTELILKEKERISFFESVISRLEQEQEQKQAPTPKQQEQNAEPLTGKYAKLRDDLKAAAEAGKAAAALVEDSGTCNFDSAALALPRWQEKKVMQAAQEAGVSCWVWNFYGNKRFVFNAGRKVGQALKNEICSETMTKELARMGYAATNYCQMD